MNKRIYEFTLPNGMENELELAFREMFPQLTFNAVTINEDQTLTIDFHENTTGSPHLTASGQVMPFLDMLDYFLYQNFPNITTYYFASSGEMDIVTEGFPNDGIEVEQLYFELVQ